MPFSDNEVVFAPDIPLARNEASCAGRRVRDNNKTDARVIDKNFGCVFRSVFRFEGKIRSSDKDIAVFRQQDSSCSDLGDSNLSRFQGEGIP